MTQPNPIEEHLSGLSAAVNQIAEATTELTQRQAVEIKKAQRASRISTILAVIVVLLIVVVVFLFVRQQNNVNRLDTIQHQVSDEAFCPLYDLFLDSYNPASPQALEDPAAYEETFAVLERGAASLGCKHRTRGRD